jgi:hypothetical protein
MSRARPNGATDPGWSPAASPIRSLRRGAAGRVRLSAPGGALLQRDLVEQPALIGPPGGKQRLRPIQHPLRPDALGVLLVNQPLQIADHMRPTQLALLLGQRVIHAGPIRMHHAAIIRAEQLPQRLLAAALLDPEAGCRWTDRDRVPSG